MKRNGPPKATAAHGCTTKGETGTIWNIWIDYSPVGGHGLAGMEMPVKYVVEMFCDRMAASKTYRAPPIGIATLWIIICIPAITI